VLQYGNGDEAVSIFHSAYAVLMRPTNILCRLVGNHSRLVRNIRNRLDYIGEITAEVSPTSWSSLHVGVSRFQN